MSTKTSIKRIALVAVAALGFGMVSTVSANAATSTTALATVGTPTYASGTIPTAGVAITVPVNMTNTGAVNSAVDPVQATLTTIPNNSALNQYTSLSFTTTNFDSTVFVVGSATATLFGLSTTAAVAGSSGPKVTVTNYSTGIAAITAKKIGEIVFTPDVPGEYVITLTGTTNRTVRINVTGAAWTQAQAGLGAASGTQVGGRIATAIFNVPSGVSASQQYQITSTAGINAVYSGTANLASGVSGYTSSTGVTKNNGTDFATGATYTVQASTTSVETISTDDYDADSELVSVQVTAPATAGTYYIYFKSINATTGVLSTSATATLTVVASGSTAISVANSTIGIQSAACPTVSTSKTGDVNALANAAPQAFGAAAGGLLHVCIYTRDGNGNLISAQTSSSIITSLGYIGTTSTPSTGATNPSSAASSLDFYLLGVSTMKGAATITATLIDAAGNAITLSTPVTWYGTLASLTLEPNAWSAQPYADGYGTSAATVSALDLVAKDANGNQIDLATAANGVTSATFTVESTGNAGTAVDRTSDSLGATVTTNFSSSDLTTYGVGNFVSVSCLSSTAPEKLTITAWGTDSLGAWVKSNSVDYYCSSSTVASLTVTPTATEVAKAGTTTLDVVAKDASGFMVPDGTAVSWATTSGSIIANSTSTLNGSLKYDATYTAADADGKVIVTAVVGTKGFSKTAELTVGTGSSETTSAVDAANEATDAANAATDAANAAAEAADAATAAAQDAQAAVTALATSVSSLIAGIKAQITSLTNLVIKIQKKVKA